MSSGFLFDFVIVILLLSSLMFLQILRLGCFRLGLVFWGKIRTPDSSMFLTALCEIDVPNVHDRGAEWGGRKETIRLPLFYLSGNLDNRGLFTYLDLKRMIDPPN